VRDHEHRIPGLSEATVANLEERYPPRCKSPGESLEHHMEYGGMVRLIAEMRTQLNDYGEDTGVDITRIVQEQSD
jgi:hypothetical protein